MTAPAAAAGASNSTSPAVEAIGLTRAFHGRHAVRDVSLSLAPGDCLALFGPNGAGKSTLLRMLAGLLRPTAGTARAGGQPVGSGAVARSMIGLLSHQSMLYPALTAQENVEFSARLHGVADPARASRDALEQMRILDRARVPVRLLSRGLQQRVSIARAIVHGPRALLLDEPYTGLDDAGARALTGVLSLLRSSGAALVLVTHNVVEGLALASHAAVMSDGRLLRFERCDARAATEATDDRAAYATAFAAGYRALVSTDA